MTTPKLEFSTTGTIILPDKESEKRVGIRTLDLNRLERKISSGYLKPTFWNEIYIIFIGIAIGALLNFITIFYTPNVPLWAIVLTICIFVFSLIIAIITYKFKVQIIRINDNFCDELISELKEMQKPFQNT